MKLVVKLVTKIDVVAVDEVGETSTFKKANNPILESVKVDDVLFLEEGGDLRVEPKEDQAARRVSAALENGKAAPSSGRGSSRVQFDRSSM